MNEPRFFYLQKKYFENKDDSVYMHNNIMALSLSLRCGCLQVTAIAVMNLFLIFEFVFLKLNNAFYVAH
jgi:hypothetical protein